MSDAFRLLAVDVDGTLMNARSELPPAHREALHRAHQAGLTVCLCTGRSLTETRMVIDQLGLDSDVGIFAFGAIISALPGGRTLNRTAFPPDLAGRLVDYFRSRGHALLILYDAAEAGFDYLLVRGERHTEAYEKWLAVSPTTIVETDQYRPGEHQAIRIGIIEEPDNLTASLSDLQAVFPDGQLKCNAIYAPNYGLHVVECFPPQVNKWTGLQWLADRLDIPHRQIAAVGDDVNDLEMIRHAGLGIAMGNAIAPIKQAAAICVPDHNRDGVAHAVDTVLSRMGE